MVIRAPQLAARITARSTLIRPRLPSGQGAMAKTCGDVYQAMCQFPGTARDQCHWLCVKPLGHPHRCACQRHLEDPWAEPVPRPAPREASSGTPTVQDPGDTFGSLIRALKAAGCVHRLRELQDQGIKSLNALREAIESGRVDVGPDKSALLASAGGDIQRASGQAAIAPAGTEIVVDPRVAGTTPKAGGAAPPRPRGTRAAPDPNA